MPSIYVDSKPFEVKARKRNLLEALSEPWFLNLPYFCWHPAMGSVGRLPSMCSKSLFKRWKKILKANPGDELHGGMWKMDCAWSIMDWNGQSFFVKQVIEWLMTNHPHDCPVCDEGGSCHLPGIWDRDDGGMITVATIIKNALLTINISALLFITKMKPLHTVLPMLSGSTVTMPVEKDLNVFCWRMTMFILEGEKDGVFAKGPFSGNPGKKFAQPGWFTDINIEGALHPQMGPTTAPSVLPSNCSLGV